MQILAKLAGGRLFGFGTVGVFLLATMGLAGWLGYQALAAAWSHQRTAEAVLRDYAQISATEFSQLVRYRLDDLVEDALELPTRRRRGESAPEAVARSVAGAAREQRCGCPELRAPAAVFRAQLDSGLLEVAPDTLSPAARAAIWAFLAEQRPLGRRSTQVVTTAGPGPVADRPVLLAAIISGRAAGGEAVGFMASAEALSELFRRWYDDRVLLPAPIARGRPNDSLLHVSIRDTSNHVYFASPVGYPARLRAVAPLGGRYAGLEVVAAIRPDAASQLIIGGLPRSRLPLLAVLLILTGGVGLAALVQIRRERMFQRLRDDFISGVSHELRTPLAQIRMFAELQESGKLGVEEDRKRAVTVIHREARRLSHLVENILQFSRLQRASELLLPAEELDLGVALAEGVDAVQPLLADRSARLTLASPAGLHVLANRDAVTRIVVNLVDNAVKYGPAGQAIRVWRRGGTGRRASWSPIRDRGSRRRRESRSGVPTGAWSATWGPAFRALESVSPWCSSSLARTAVGRGWATRRAAGPASSWSCHWRPQ